MTNVEMTVDVAKHAAQGNVQALHEWRFKTQPYLIATRSPPGSDSRE